MKKFLAAFVMLAMVTLVGCAGGEESEGHPAPDPTTSQTGVPAGEESTLTETEKADMGEQPAP